jgi:hypothetical protein
VIPEEAEVVELERQWADAFQRKDIAGLQRLMANNYALVIAVEGTPLQVIPRNAWLESLDAYEIDEVGIDQVYVRIYKSVAVVSMLWRQKARLRGQKARSLLWTYGCGTTKAGALRSHRAARHVGCSPVILRVPDQLVLSADRLTGIRTADRRAPAHIRTLTCARRTMST